MIKKTIFLLFYLLSFPLSLFCQTGGASDDKYSSLQSLFEVFDMPEGRFKLFVKSSKEDILSKIRHDSSMTNITDEEIQGIMKLCVDYIAPIEIRKLIEDEISILRFSKDDINHLLNINNLENKILIIDKQINLIVENHFVQYSYQKSSKKWIKSFHIYHDNDVLLFSKINADRDYTGGFRFELTTDQLKMKLFKKFGNSDNILSYQSLFLGGEGYTPYIRFSEQQLKERNVFYELDSSRDFFSQPSLDSIQQYLRDNQQLTDRPFASFQYVGRGKYRLHHAGFFRSESLFKIGKIGGLVGENIQAVIHQDLNVGSQRVLNWKDQIASGGRLAFNIEHQIDISVFGVDRWLSWQKSGNIKRNKFAENLNLYIPVELAIGTVQTHIGTGIALSNKSFRTTSGHNDIHGVRLSNLWTKLWHNTYVDIKYRYRYVVHNSMLEGVGIVNTFQDDPLDDEAVTVYSLRDKDINRCLHRVSFQIGFRLNKITFYYKQERFINKEFSLDEIKPQFKEFETLRWYGYGRIGLNFLI